MELRFDRPRDVGFLLDKAGVVRGDHFEDHSPEFFAAFFDPFGVEDVVFRLSRGQPRE